MTAPGQHGGYRQPENPAPVSGPAQLSARTDGGPGSSKQPIRVANGGGYGERTASIEQQQGAPLAEAPGPPNPPAPSTLAEAMGGGGAPSGPPAEGGFQRPPLTGFTAPSERPGEPVTAGAPMGAGPGPSWDDRGPQPRQLSQALAPFFAEDDTDTLRMLAYDLDEWGL